MGFSIPTGGINTTTMNLYSSIHDGEGDDESTVIIDRGIKMMMKKKKTKLKSIASDRYTTVRVHRSRWSRQRLVDAHF